MCIDHRRFALRGFGVTALLLVLSWIFGLSLNVSASLPLGLYQVSDNGNVKAGDLVVFCLQGGWQDVALQRRYLQEQMLGHCQGGTPLLKRVQAVPGDRYETEPRGVRINGRLVTLTAIKSNDRQGRPLHSSLAVEGLLREGEYLVFGETEHSFDSRYFGAIRGRQFLQRVRPLWVNGEE